MATNKDDGTDFGNPDIDDLDWGDPLEDTPDPGKDRKPVERFGHGFLKGVRETAKTPSVYTNALRTALPEGYSAAFQLADDVVQKSQGLYNEVAKDLAPAGREVKKLLRNANKAAEGYLPQKLSKKIAEFLKEEPAVAKNYSNYDPTETTISSELTEVFKTQIEQTETTRAENMIRDGVEKKRFTSQFKQLDEIRRLLNKQVAYQDSVNMSYQRKSLEIQMRQMFIQRDLLEVTKASAQETSAQLKDITKNTGLPEAVKLRNSEIWEQLAKERLLGKVNDRFAPLVREVFNRVSTNIGKRIKEVSGNIRDGVDQAISMNDMVEGVDVDKTAMAGQLAGSGAVNWVSQKLAKIIKPHLQKNKSVAAKGNNLLYMSENWDQILKKKIEDHSPRTWFGEVLQDSVLGALRWGGQQKIGHDSISEATAATPWDNLSRKSLVEIIPGFLARILQSSEGIRTRRTAPLMTYDHTRNEFTTVADLSSKFHQRLVADDDLSRISEDSESIIDLFDKNKELSPETRAKVKQYLLREVRKNNIADFERFTEHHSYKNLGMSGKEIDQVVELLQTGLGMDWKGNVGSDYDSTLLRQQFASKMRSLRSTVPQFSDRANMFANTSNMDALRRAGVVRKVMDEDHLDSSYVERRFRQFLMGEQPDADSSDETYPGSALDRHYDAIRSDRSPGHQGTDSNYRSGRTAGNSDLTAAMETLRQQLGTQHAKQIEVLEALAGEKGTSLVTLSNAVKDASSKDELLETNKILREILEELDALKSNGIPVTGTQRYDTVRHTDNSGPSNDDRPIGDRVKSAFQQVKESVTNTDFSKLKDIPEIAGKNAREIWEQLDPRKIELGVYRDKFTGAVITKLADIKNVVSDYSEQFSDKYEATKSKFGGKNRVRALGRRYLGRGPYGLIEGAMRLGAAGVKSAGLGIKDAGRMLWNSPAAIASGIGKAYQAGKWVAPKLVPGLKLAKGIGGYGVGQVAKGFGDLLRLSKAGVKGLGWGLPGALKLGSAVGGAAAKGGYNLLKYGAGQLGKGIGDVGKILGFGKKLLTGGLPFMGRAKKIHRSIDRIYDLLVRFFAYKGMPIDQLKADGVDDDTGKLKIKQRIKSVYDRMRERQGSIKARLSGWKDSLAKYRRKGPDDAIEKPEEKKEGGNWFTTLLGVITGLSGTITGALGGLGKMLTGKLTWLGEYLAAKSAIGSAADAIDGVDLPDSDGKGKGRAGKKRGWWNRLKGKAKAGARAVSRSRAAGFLGRAAGAIGLRGLLAGAGAAAASAIGGTVAAIGAVLTAPVVLTAAAIGTAGYFVYKYYKEKLEPFQKLRMAQYGIPLDERDAILKVAETEKDLLEYVTWTGNTATGIREGFNVQAILERFGVNTRDPASIKGMTVWFNNRFKPVYLRYLSVIRTLTPSIGLQELDGKVPKEKVESFVNALKFNDATKNHPYAVLLSPFDGIDIVPGTTEIDDAAKEVMDTIKEWKRENKAKEISSKSQDVKSGTTITDMMKLDAEKRKAAEIKQAMVQSGGLQGRGMLRDQLSMLEQRKAGETGVAAAMTQARIDQKAQYLNQSMAAYSKANPTDEKWLQQIQEENATFKKTFKTDAPKDGYYAKVPAPSGDGSWDAVRETILTAAALMGVDANTLANFARAESGFKTNAGAGTSSAKGLFQFINSTWRGMMDQYGAELGIPMNAKPTDPVAASLLAAQLLKLNNASLRGTLGREPSVTDSYMAHFLGPGGANRFFKASPDAIAAELLPKEASANRSIFYGPSGPRTVSQVYALMSKKMTGSGTPTAKQLVDAKALQSAVAANDPLNPEYTASKVTYNKQTKTATASLMPEPSVAPRTVSVTGSQPFKRQDVMVPTAQEKAELRVRQVQEQHKLVAENQAAALNNAVSILEESLRVQQSMNTGIRDISTMLKSIVDKPVVQPVTKPEPQVAASAPKPRPVTETPNIPIGLRRNV